MTTWKTIPGFGRHYQISTEGLVRVSLKSPRIKELKNDPRVPWMKKPGGEVKRHLGKDGYWRINLKNEGGQNGSYHIHRLLMMSFRPTRVPHMQVNHKDGRKDNNALDNLEWVTQQENLRHAWVNKLRAQPRHVILTAAQVKEIRATYVKGQFPSLRELGEKYGVTGHAIWRIVNNKNWKNI